MFWVLSQKLRENALVFLNGSTLAQGNVFKATQNRRVIVSINIASHFLQCVNWTIRVVEESKLDVVVSFSWFPFRGFRRAACLHYS